MTRVTRAPVPPSAVVGRWVILLVPTVLLLVGSLRAEGQRQQFLWLGTTIELLAALALLTGPRVSLASAVGMPGIALYLIGLLWLWVTTTDFTEWYPHFAQAILLVIPLVLFAAQTLVSSGATAMRRARLLARGLSTRQDWPERLEDCKAMPEVKALRDALADDAGPALPLLEHPLAEVRLCALTALEYRREWEHGQAELVVTAGRRSPEPVVRAAAVLALANVEDRHLVEALAAFLADPAPEVRKAACEALLWDAGQRWGYVSNIVQVVLNDARFAEDGPLICAGSPLPGRAVDDLLLWAAETGPLGRRSALTVVAHYSTALMAGPTPELVDGLRERVADPRTPPLLRVELAHVLNDHQQLDRDLLEALLDGANPTPLRLLAAECLLVAGPHARAVDALRDISRQPNRDIGLLAASIVQRCLGIDMGLALQQPLPSALSRQAAEVTRRVMLWANGKLADVQPVYTPASGQVRRPSSDFRSSVPRQTLPGMRRRSSGGQMIGSGSGVKVW